MSNRNDIQTTGGGLTAATFRSFVELTALSSLSGSMDEAEAKRIAGMTALGFFTAMRTAKDPSAMLDCTKDSIRAAIATSVGTRLVVGTPNAPAYLVPQRPRSNAPMELQFRVNHRGWSILGYRAGFMIDPVPVGLGDSLSVRGATIDLEQDPDNVPQTKDELRGVVVYITELKSGHTFTTWVPVKIIAARAKLSRGGHIWDQWPVEMAMGAAVRYAVARGKLPIDTADVHEAMGAELRADAIETTAITSTPATAPAQITDDELAASLAGGTIDTTAEPVAEGAPADPASSTYGN